MRGLPQKQNARRADKIKLCGHLRRYKKIVKKTYIILCKISFIILKGQPYCYEAVLKNTIDKPRLFLLLSDC